MHAVQIFSHFAHCIKIEQKCVYLYVDQVLIVTLLTLTELYKTKTLSL